MYSKKEFKVSLKLNKGSTCTVDMQDINPTPQELKSVRYCPAFFKYFLTI